MANKVFIYVLIVRLLLLSDAEFYATVHGTTGLIFVAGDRLQFTVTARGQAIGVHALINQILAYGFGALVRQMLNGIDPMLPVRTVHASRGKAARAEPVAALYEQGRVTHLRHLQDLEDQMCQMTVTGYSGKGSPDRLDALVWAIYALMIEPASGWQTPGIRLL